MAGDVEYNINGYIWTDVTNRTAAGVTYSMRDVVACGGRQPWVISINSGERKPKSSQSKYIPRKDPK